MTAEALATCENVLRVPLARLHPSPTNPRKHLGDLTELAASIKQVGVLEPLVARPLRASLEAARAELAKVERERDDLAKNLHVAVEDCAFVASARDELLAKVRDLRSDLSTRDAELKACREELAKAESEHERTLLRRDDLENKLDAFVELAGGEEECGEHSSDNDPWRRAYERLEEIIIDRHADEANEHDAEAIPRPFGGPCDCAHATNHALPHTPGCPGFRVAYEAEPAGAERAIVVRSVWRFNDHLPGDNAMRTVTAYVPRETLTTSRDDMAYGGWDWRDREEEFRARHTWVRDPPSPPATSGETEK